MLLTRVVRQTDQYLGWPFSKMQFDRLNSQALLMQELGLARLDLQRALRCRGNVILVPCHGV